mmetsp:Transcript_4269/g.7940  ORF Transcript_4269/g.7940 Transcript_4269/m.7940 type:complete len:113 (-) Transcript_4269:861-1199(-)
MNKITCQAMYTHYQAYTNTNAYSLFDTSPMTSIWQVSNMSSMDGTRTSFLKQAQVCDMEDYSNACAWPKQAVSENVTNLFSLVKVDYLEKQSIENNGKKMIPSPRTFAYRSA